MLVSTCAGGDEDKGGDKSGQDDKSGRCTHTRVSTDQQLIATHGSTTQMIVCMGM